VRFQQLTQGEVTMRVNEELVKAGVLLAGEGLHPSARGKRVHFSGSQRTVIDGDSEIEIRPLFEAADFGAELTPELRAQEERLRAEVEGVANRPR